jgi:hypothetical protein
MPFEARALRVQLPCKSVTVIPAEVHDAELKARQYWRDILTPYGQCTGCTDCSNVTDLCKGRSEAGVLFCAGTDPIEVLATIDATVLPVLRKQLEARLQEITAAEEAVAEATRQG